MEKNGRLYSFEDPLLLFYDSVSLTNFATTASINFTQTHSTICYHPECFCSMFKPSFTAVFSQGDAIKAQNTDILFVRLLFSTQNVSNFMTILL